MEESEPVKKSEMEGISSTDIVSLNNMVVNLRPTTKKSRIQVIQRLNKTIKALREKSGNPNDNRSKRASKLVEEIRILKTTGIDDITKFCLSQCGIAQNDSKNDKEQAALARVAKHKAISEKIQSLMKEHQDWDSLVFYIKNHIPRRVKKKAANKRTKLEAKNKPIEQVTAIAPSTETRSSTTVAEEVACHLPVPTDETVAKLRSLGGVVQAFGAEDDCELGQLQVDAFNNICEEYSEKAQNKSSKKRFFEGCSDGDDDDGDKNNECDFQNTKQRLFRKKHFSEPKKPFTKNLKHKENQHKQSEIWQNKHTTKKPMDNLHPSWEAKRKEKELLKNAPSERTKIVFDD